MDFEAIVKSGKFDMLEPEQVDGQFGKTLEALERVGIVDENILAYYACVRLLEFEIIDEQKAALHNEAAAIIYGGFSFMNGAAALAFYHMQKAMELEPENLKYKLVTLQALADAPGFEMDAGFRVAIAKDILKLEPQNVIGLRYCK